MTPIAKKLIPVALVAAVLGGTAGAIITKTVRSNQEAIPAAASTTTPAPVADQSATANTVPGTADNSALNATTQQAVAPAENRTNTRTVYRTATRSSRAYSSRRAYYDYNSQAQKRSFWDKHRDKLTVAMGAGGGALVGGLIGGKKGAGIGLLSGGAGSALYTYKIRKHNNR